MSLPDQQSSASDSPSPKQRRVRPDLRSITIPRALIQAAEENGVKLNSSFFSQLLRNWLFKENPCEGCVCRKVHAAVTAAMSAGGAQ